VRQRALPLLLAVVALLVPGIVVVSGAAASTTPAVHVTATWLRSPTYTPRAPAGATDDYHCTIVDPHLTKASYLVASQFFPGSDEDHHAALFLLPASLEATARTDGALAHGWTCFGEGTLPDTPLAEFAQTTLLSNWSPGSGPVVFPRGTGYEIPAGSLVIMQVHYNLLAGDRPVHNALVLKTVPISTPLVPLAVQTMESPPDLPCPTGVTGPLCSRATSLANQGHRFGATAVTIVNSLEALCGRDPANPPVGDSTSCTSAQATSGYLMRVAPHMHLLGTGFTMVADAGTPHANTILRVDDYDFHHQHAYNLAHPVAVTAGEPITVTCTYNPRLQEELPILRRVPPHFVTWGDGSTDEMCVGVTWTAPRLPAPHAAA
jgi:hypothetical protein